MLKRYVEIGVDVAVACGAYYLFGWIGLTLWALFVISWFATQLISNQQVIMTTLLSRLPWATGLSPFLYCITDARPITLSRSGAVAPSVVIISSVKPLLK